MILERKSWNIWILYSIIIDKGEKHKYYVFHIFKSIFSGPNSTFDIIVGSAKGDEDTGSKVSSGELIQNATENQNNMVAAK